MSKRHLGSGGDHDENSNPDNPQVIRYANIVEAAERIKSHVIYTPCRISHHNKDFVMNVLYKLESEQMTGSFKERGAVNAFLSLPLEKMKLGVVISSVGNYAASMCYHAARFSIPITVVMPRTVPISKLQHCLNLGAKVVVQGNDITEAQRYARAICRNRGLTYINGRDHPAMLAGHGTVAMEILEQVPGVDAILVPVGTGGLAAAVATVVKHTRPTCLVYGVEPEVMPALFNSLENGKPVLVPCVNTIADSIGMPSVGVNAFATVKPIIDKMLLVKEDWIARGILHMVEEERFVVEGAGACPLAAILGSLVPELKTKTVVCIITGGNIDAVLLGRVLDRGRAAEGRLVKFKVGIPDQPRDLEQMMKLLAAGGFNVVRYFRDKVWVEDDVYHVEFKFVAETRGLEHALELKQIVEKAYPETAVFESEPFSDSRTCSCYVRKAA